MIRYTSSPIKLVFNTNNDQINFSYIRTSTKTTAATVDLIPATELNILCLHYNRKFMRFKIIN